MGLDSSLYLFDVDNDDNTDNYSEIGYLRNSHDLHRWIEERAENNLMPTHDDGRIEVSYEDLNELENLIFSRDLYGTPDKGVSPDLDYKFVSAGKLAIIEGYKVFYSGWL